MTALIPVPPPVSHGNLLDLVTYVTNSVPSPGSKIKYRQAITSFLAFAAPQRRSFDRALVQGYKTHLEASGKSPATINQHLAAIRALAREARYAGEIDRETEQGIKEVPSAKLQGSTCGRWLDLTEMRALLDSVDTSTLSGRRDFLLIGIMVGAGLRRTEAVSLNRGHVQRHGQKYALVDFIGKGNKKRTVILPQRLYPVLDTWMAEILGDPDSPLLCSFSKNSADNLRLDDSSAYWILKQYTSRLGYDISPHDLRRSFGRAALKGGADINDVRIGLGHESVATTTRYLGTNIDWADPVAERVGL